MEDMKNMTREGMMSTCLELEAMAQKLLNRRLEVANLVAETELEDSQLLGFYLCMQRALCSEDRPPGKHRPEWSHRRILPASFPDFP